MCSNALSERNIQTVRVRIPDDLWYEEQTLVQMQVCLVQKGVEISKNFVDWKVVS